MQVIIDVAKSCVRRSFGQLQTRYATGWDISASSWRTGKRMRRAGRKCTEEAVSHGGDSLKIIANGYVVTCDPGNRGGRYNLLIRDGRIIEIPIASTSLPPCIPTLLLLTPRASSSFRIRQCTRPFRDILLRCLTKNLHFGLWKKNIHLANTAALLTDPNNHEDVLSVMLTAYFAHLKAGRRLSGIRLR